MSQDLRTERGLDRLVNFTDAAVAIAITLLVLPLVDLATDSGGQHLGPMIRENSGTFIAFAVTFVVIGRLWLGHHQLFERLRSYDTVVVSLDLVWLGCIVVLPFAAQELSALYSSDRAVYALYIGVMAVSFIALALIGERVARRPDLRRTDVTGPPGVGAWVAAGILVVALGLAMLFPGVGMYWLLLLLLSDSVERVLTRLR